LRLRQGVEGYSTELSAKETLHSLSTEILAKTKESLRLFFPQKFSLKKESSIFLKLPITGKNSWDL
jgi:hypothetical protein